MGYIRLWPVRADTDQLLIPSYILGPLSHVFLNDGICGWAVNWKTNSQQIWKKYIVLSHHSYFCLFVWSNTSIRRCGTCSSRSVWRPVQWSTQQPKTTETMATGQPLLLPCSQTSTSCTRKFSELNIDNFLLTAAKCLSVIDCDRNVHSSHLFCNSVLCYSWKINICSKYILLVLFIFMFTLSITVLNVLFVYAPTPPQDIALWQW